MLRTKVDIIIPAGTVFVPVEGKFLALIADGDGEMLIEIGQENADEHPEVYERC